MSSSPSPFSSRGKPFCLSCFSSRWLGRPGACDRCGAYNDLLAPQRWESSGPLGKLLNWLLAPLGGWYWGLVTLATLWTIYVESIAWTVNLLHILLLFLAWGVLIMIWGVRMGCRSLGLFMFPAGEAKRPGWRRFGLFPAIIIFLIFLQVTEVPLRVGLRLHRSALLALPPDGRYQNVSTSAGIYHVKRTWSHQGIRSWIIQSPTGLSLFDLRVSYYPPPAHGYWASVGRRDSAIGDGWFYHRYLFD